MPKVESYQELQEHVARKCLQYCMNHRIKTRTRTIKDMLDEERTYLLPLPAYPLDTAEEVKANVHSDLTVRVGSTKYSVPSEYVGLSVTVKISPFNVDIYHMGKLIWKHKKGLYPQDHQYVTEHYLEILQRKPRAIKNAIPINNGIMPQELKNFLKLCKDRDKNVQLVNILLLARKLDNDLLLWAVKQANLTGVPNYDRVCFYVEISQRKDDLPKTIETEFNIDHANLEEYDQLIERKSKV